MEYLPLTQSMQGAVPGEILYVPVAQPVQIIACSGWPVDPLLHVQSLRASLPEDDDDREGQFEHALDVEEYLPASQSMHAVDPSTVLYFPGAHVEQDPGSPVSPTGQSPGSSHTRKPATVLSTNPALQ